jgi:lipopolysaccharide biosynthesis glycosyltransferase
VLTTPQRCSSQSRSDKIFLNLNCIDNLKDMIHIVCSTDANYIMPTVVMIKSVCMSNRDEGISFHVIVDESVTARQRKQLEEVVEGHDRHHVLFHLVDGNMFSGFPQLGITKTYITKATYHRLLFTDLFDKDIHRLIYLDGNMIVTGPLRPLWETDLDGYAVGAVTDMSERIHDYHRLGYPASLGYFNAGMLLVNLDYWREHKAKDLFMDIILHHPERIKYHDQDVMNIVFCQCKKMVPFRYNFQDGFMYKPERMEMDADKYAAQISDAISHAHSFARSHFTEEVYGREMMKIYRRALGVSNR